MEGLLASLVLDFVAQTIVAELVFDASTDIRTLITSKGTMGTAAPYLNIDPIFPFFREAIA